VEGMTVAKRSPGKATTGGRKWAWRVADRAEEFVALSPDSKPLGGRTLQATVVEEGRRLPGPSLQEARVFHREVLAELPPGLALVLVRG